MKKLLILSFILFNFISISYSEALKVKTIINSIDIISPDDKLTNYTNPSDIKNIIYSSKIFAKGMIILDYNSVNIILKNQQGIFVTKDPISKALIFSKLENTREGTITIEFTPTVIANMDTNCVFSLKYDEKDNSVTMKIIDGYATMKVEEENIELIKNETFKHICKKEKEVNNAI